MRVKRNVGIGVKYSLGRFSAHHIQSPLIHKQVTHATTCKSFLVSVCDSDDTPQYCSLNPPLYRRHQTDIYPPQKPRQLAMSSPPQVYLITGANRGLGTHAALRPKLKLR